MSTCESLTGVPRDDLDLYRGRPIRHLQAGKREPLSFKCLTKLWKSGGILNNNHQRNAIGRILRSLNILLGALLQLIGKALENPFLQPPEEDLWNQGGQSPKGAQPLAWHCSFVDYLQPPKCTSEGAAQSAVDDSLQARRNHADMRMLAKFHRDLLSADFTQEQVNPDFVLGEVEN